MKQFLLGFGSPLVDYTLNVSDEILARIAPGIKGGTESISRSQKAELLAAYPGNILRSPGGSAANTVMAAARLGVSSALWGKIGNDEDGAFFCGELESAGADSSHLSCNENSFTGSCVTLVTPDAERTMRSALGASLTLKVEEVKNTSLSCRWLLAEGYWIGSPVLPAVLQRAKESGAKVALNLSSLELAREYREVFTRLITRWVDLVFANVAEAEALTGKSGKAALFALMELAPQAVVTRSASGAWCGENGHAAAVGAMRVHAVDMTAAGDYFSAGFFYGLSQGRGLPYCCAAGSRVAGEIVQLPGTRLPQEKWEMLRRSLADEEIPGGLEATEI